MSKHSVTYRKRSTPETGKIAFKTLVCEFHCLILFSMICRDYVVCWWIFLSSTEYSMLIIFIIVVAVQPRFQVNYTQQAFVWAGRARNVTCQVDAHPTPDIEWFHNGMKIEFNETFRIFQTDGLFKSTSHLQVLCDWLVAPVCDTLRCGKTTH